MKLSRMLTRIGLVGLFAYAAVRELLRPAEAESPAAPPPSRLPLIAKTAAATIAVGLILALLGGVAFAFSGVYDLAAGKPHTRPVAWFLKTMMTRTVHLHAIGVSVPGHADAALLNHGFALYRINCQPCHGAPGVAPEQIGRGINPKPPRLEETGTNWSDPELFWIVSEGLKMSGMPAFAPRLSDRDRWAIVAFVRRLNRFSPTMYAQMSAAADRGIEISNWGDNDCAGFERVRGASPERGRRFFQQFGCVTCHMVPGASRSSVGPPLTAFAEREYIAGILVNLPSNAIRWIVDPQKYKPGTAMPNVGVPDRDATDIVGYLYSLGDPKRLRDLEEHGCGH